MRYGGRHWLWGRAMDERIVGILERIETLEMARIASGALGFQVTDAGPLTYSEISTPHAEGRTVAIIKVEIYSAAGKMPVQ